MNKAEYFLRKHSGTILTIIGSTGVVATAILSVKAVPKAEALLTDAYNKKGAPLTTAEKIRASWKAYIPAGVTGISTIACIFGINYLSTRNQASLMSAYALLDNTFKEYRNKVNDIYGEDADSKVKAAIVESKEDYDLPLEDDKLLFFDWHSMRHFTSTMSHVMQAECAFLELIRGKGYATMNEYYSLLGLPPVSFGETLGWFDYERIDPYRCEELEFHYEEMTMKNGMKCWVIDTNLPPTTDFIL